MKLRGSRACAFSVEIVSKDDLIVIDDLKKAIKANKKVQVQFIYHNQVSNDFQ